MTSDSSKVMPAEEADFYRHKKFDQRKRSRDSSVGNAINFASGSSSNDGGDSTCSIEQQYNIMFYTASLKRRRSGEYNDTDVAVNLSKQQKLCGTTVDGTLKRTRVKSSKPATTAAAAATSSSANMRKINDETLRTVCKYHVNMVRKFPKKQRTAKDQERRNKNTIACRVSRRVKKLEHIAFEEEYKDYSQQYFKVMEENTRLSAYLNEVMKLSALSALIKCKTSEKGMGETTATATATKTITNSSSPKKEKKKCFSIEFLTGK